MKEKFQIEYPLHTIAKLIFPKLSTVTGLEQWFADHVQANKNTYTFNWSGINQVAELSMIRENQLVRFNWKDDPENTYFEFKLRVDDITNDMELIVTDFIEESEKDDAIELWDAQIANLKHILGLNNE
jgi:hypothetical protein